MYWGLRPFPRAFDQVSGCGMIFRAIEFHSFEGVLNVFWIKPEIVPNFSTSIQAWCPRACAMAEKHSLSVSLGRQQHGRKGVPIV